MIVDKLNDIINSYGEKSSLKTFCLYVRDNIYDTDPEKHCLIIDDKNLVLPA